MKKIIPLLFFIFCFMNIIVHVKAAKPVKELKPTEEKAVYKFLVTDDNNIPEENAAVILTSEKGVINGLTDASGRFTTLLDKGAAYMISVEKFGQVFEFNAIDLPMDDELLNIEKQLKIKYVIHYLRIYTLENVYFNSGKTTIRPESFKALNELVARLKKNSKMMIEIAGHTDDTGDDTINMKLSQDRVNSVKQYCIKHGIAPKRIIAKGYGETAPLTSNKTEIGKKRNRRVEIRIIQE